MIGKKTLRDVQTQLIELLRKLPAENPHSWLDREIEGAQGQAGRDVETLRMLQSALQRAGAKKKKKAKLARR